MDSIKKNKENLVKTSEKKRKGTRNPVKLGKKRNQEEKPLETEIPRNKGKLGKNPVKLI